MAMCILPLTFLSKVGLEQKTDRQWRSTWLPGSRLKQFHSLELPPLAELQLRDSAGLDRITPLVVM